MRQFILIAVLISVAASATAGQTRAGERPCPTVTGEGMVRVAPDRATVTMSAEARAREPDRAREESAAAMTSMIAKLRGLDVPAEAIRTVRVELQSEFAFMDGKRTRRGYVATNTIEIRIDDVASVRHGH